MNNFFKKIKKIIVRKRRYAAIGVIIVSNEESIKALREQTVDPRYDLVPIYSDLRLKMYPFEYPEATLKRKRKSIKKQVGKHNFKVLQGFWTFGIDFFDMQEYQDLLVKKAEKKARKKAKKKAEAQED